MVNTIDVTVSGYPKSEIYLPNGNCIYFIYEDYHSFWRTCKSPDIKTLNLVNIESFKQLSFPLADIKITPKKNVSWVKRFWYAGWKDEKIFDIDIKVIGMKDVTLVKTRSGEHLYVDESTECLKNALDASVWFADIRDVMK